VPAPDFLDRILGFFADPGLGFVQAMLTFSNARENLLAQASAQTSYGIRIQCTPMSIVAGRPRGCAGVAASMGLPLNVTVAMRRISSGMVRRVSRTLQAQPTRGVTASTERSAVSGGGRPWRGAKG